MSWIALNSNTPRLTFWEGFSAAQHAQSNCPRWSHLPASVSAWWPIGNHKEWPTGAHRIAGWLWIPSVYFSWSHWSLEVCLNADPFLQARLFLFISDSLGLVAPWSYNVRAACLFWDGPGPNPVPLSISTNATELTSDGLLDLLLVYWSDSIWFSFLDVFGDAVRRVVPLYYVTEIGDAMAKALQRSAKIDSQPWKTSSWASANQISCWRWPAGALLILPV